LFIELEGRQSGSVSKLEWVLRGARTAARSYSRCCCLCTKAGLGLIVGVAPVSRTMSTWTESSSSFDRFRSRVPSFDDGSSSPIEEADDWEKRVDLVVFVEIEELDWLTECVRRRVGSGEVEMGGGESSPMERPAAMNLLTPCTPSRIPSSMAPLPCPWEDVPSELGVSKPWTMIRSHLLFTVGGINRLGVWVYEFIITHAQTTLIHVLRVGSVVQDIWILSEQ